MDTALLWARFRWQFFFWWRTAQTSFEGSLHFFCRSDKLWGSRCVKGASTQSSRQLRSTSGSVTWACYLRPRCTETQKEPLLGWLAQDVELEVTANFRSLSISVASGALQLRLRWCDGVSTPFDQDGDISQSSISLSHTLKSDWRKKDSAANLAAQCSCT